MMKKIVTCKHLAARMAVEQACDVGPMFKITKGVVKTMPTESKSISPISFRITSILNDLSTTDPVTSGRVAILASHKKKAIIAGISKLPVAMAAAFKEGLIQSAFKSNGQINKEGIIPDVHSLAGTYHASITNDHYLKDTTKQTQRLFYIQAYNATNKSFHTVERGSNNIQEEQTSV